MASNLCICDNTPGNQALGIVELIYMSNQVGRWHASAPWPHGTVASPELLAWYQVHRVAAHRSQLLDAMAG